MQEHIWCESLHEHSAFPHHIWSERFFATFNMSSEPKSDGIIFRHVRIQDSDRRGFQTIRLCWRCQDWKQNSTVLHKTVAATEKILQEKSLLPVRNHGISKNSHPCKIVCCRKGRLIPEIPNSKIRVFYIGVRPNIQIHIQIFLFCVSKRVFQNLGSRSNIVLEVFFKLLLIIKTKPHEKQ